MAALTCNINETLAVKETHRAPARCVLSDLLLAVGDLTLEDFAARLAAGGPVGYEPFRNYIAGGDYEYQRAVYRAVLRASSASAPRLLTLELGVDVPDIFDRGAATASAGGLVRVDFSRPFNASPEVIAAAEGGTVVAQPRVHNVTTTGFDMELVAVSGSRVAGQVTWSAKGY